MENITVDLTVEDLLRLAAEARRTVSKSHRQRIWLRLIVVGEATER